MAEQLAELNKNETSRIMVESIKRGVHYTTSWQTVQITFTHKIIAASVRFDVDLSTYSAYVLRAYVIGITDNVVTVVYNSNVAANLAVVVDAFYIA